MRKCAATSTLNKQSCTRGKESRRGEGRRMGSSVPKHSVGLRQFVLLCFTIHMFTIILSLVPNVTFSKKHLSIGIFLKTTSLGGGEGAEPGSHSFHRRGNGDSWQKWLCQDSQLGASLWLELISLLGVKLFPQIKPLKSDFYTCTCLKEMFISSMPEAHV